MCIVPVLKSSDDMQQGRMWDGEDPTGYYAAEKMDGCRGFWDGRNLWSKSGRRIEIPAAWAQGLPKRDLEGEVWAGRGQWETTVAAVVRNVWAPHVGFIVFDAPSAPGDWAERMQAGAESLRCDFAAPVPWCTVRNLKHASELVRKIRLGGGEGLMLVRPGVAYR